MNRDEATEVLLTIHEIYPKFDLTERKLRVLIPTLLPMNYNGVMKKLNDHIVANPFPPTISEIAVYPKPVNQMLKKTDMFEQVAAENPPSQEQIMEFTSRFKAILGKG